MGKLTPRGECSKVIITKAEEVSSADELCRILVGLEWALDGLQWGV